jgi:predicted nuclease with TOPRIM domain
MNNLTEMATILAGVLGTAGLWKFAETRLKVRAEQKKENIINSDGHQYRDDLKKRVTKLEELLEASAKEKDDLRAAVLQLTGEVAALRTKVEFLERENDRLKER